MSWVMIGLHSLRIIFSAEESLGKSPERKGFFLVCVSGTCINNTSVMMFKKGSFEIGATVYPVAIKVQDF